jgi:hypothetical protein
MGSVLRKELAMDFRKRAIGVGVRLTCALVAVGMAACTSPSSPTRATPLTVIDASGQIAGGFDLLVNTDRNRTDWLTHTSEGLLAAYPSGQQWGFVGVVLQGSPSPGSRPGRDLSGYRTLRLELRGAAGGETVEIGIKDTTDPDDGSEVKRTVTVSREWQPFTFPIADFSRADAKRIYLLFEMVFGGATGKSVYFRDVQYLP